MKHIDVYRSLALERDGQGRIRVDLDQVSSTVQLCIGRMYLDDMVDWAYRQHTRLLPVSMKLCSEVVPQHTTVTS